MRSVKIASVLVVFLGIVAVVSLVAPLFGQSRAREDRATRFGVQVGAGGEIGVSVRDVDQADITREKLGDAAGAVIDEVRSDSAAARAGLKSGDVVIEFDGEKVRSARQFSRLVQESAPGRGVTATVMREGRRVDVTITPEAGTGRVAEFRPDLRDLERLGRDLRLRIPDIDLPGFDVDVRMRAGRLGASVMELQPQLAEYFGVKDGVLVTAVSEGSAADRAGLKAGDVITTVDGEPIGDSSALRRRTSSDGTREITVGIVRDRKQMILKVTIEDRSASSRGRPV
jgi:serine protease Do